ncbi:MAG: chemotaxis protein CheW [Oculatellaceae cyanobacterium Prado106]|nr:chemotaxis protein CheW [Oculatellaceae cyanobacterium Prado106]
MTTAIPTTENAEQFLSFHLTETLHAMLPTQQLTEILNLALHQLVPIPDVAPQVMGVCNWRGDVLWLVDLGYLLGAEPLYSQGYRRSHYKAIIVHHQGHTLGLVVSQVNQMLWCDPAQIQSLPEANFVPELSNSFQGYWLTPTDETLLVLDSRVLVEFFLQSTTHHSQDS